MSQASGAPRVVRLTVPGAPRTKKNHGSVIQRGGRRYHIPSAAWTAWAEAACLRLAHVPRLPDRPYNVAALFFRDRNAGDAVGYYQGLADLLEAAGVVSNDKWLVSWDGTRLMLDRANPRVEITLTEAD